MVAGTVTSWKKGFGFVELKNGKTAYVHTTILPEGHGLSIGANVNITYEEVEGHDGRVKATACTGAGVVPKAQSGKGGGGEDKRKDTDGKWYTKSEFIEQYGGLKEWNAKAAPAQGKGAGKGAGRPAGGQQKGAKGGEEKRKDTDGKMYTRAEFVKQYGGTREWDARGAAQKRAAVGPAIIPGQAEKRKDTDGKWYTMEEFRKQYGGLAQWNQRAPAAASRGAGVAARGGGARGAGVANLKGPAVVAGGEEKRKDTDGKWYTRQDFLKQYGGLKEWEAREERKDASDGKWYNKQSFLKVYGNLSTWATAERRHRPQAAAGGRGAAMRARGRGSG
eukprot:Hpha_TRINITY_DN16001_c1_g1::TRINITY_DN16001_c1_g1_i1::g.121372::m.121372